MTSRFFGRRRRRRGHLATDLAAVAAGAGLVYFLDPRRGPGRRAQVAQRAGRVAREVEGTVEAGTRDLKHRAAGLAHEVRARTQADHAPDEVIVERVRAKLGRLTAHPGAIEVVSRGGHVELRGPVFAAERGRVLRGVRAVRGVRSVDDRLEPHETAEGVSALQGAGPRPGPLPEPLQGSWSPGTKLLVGAAGALLAGRALLGGGALRIPAGVAGAALLGKLLADSGPARRETHRVARAASLVANREAERLRARAGHQGAWHPEAEAGPGEGRPEAPGGPQSLSPGPTGPGGEPPRDT